MQSKFRFYEVVTVVSTPSFQGGASIVGKEGIVVGMSEPYSDGTRDFGVHFNHFGETFTLHQDQLISCNRIASARDVKSSSPFKDWLDHESEQPN